jgi:hypothetical protein
MCAVGEEGLRVVVSREIRADHAVLGRLIEQGFAGVDPMGVEVRVERALRSWDSFTGRAYPEPPSRPKAHPGTRYLVRLKLPATLRNRGYPQSYQYPRLKTAPSITVRDWRERLVALAAHEAFHVRQFRQGLRRSEVAAERWANSRLAAWRMGEQGSPVLSPAGVVALPRPLTRKEGFAEEERTTAAAFRWEQLSLLP